MFFTASEEDEYGGKKGFFFVDAGSDTAGQYTKDERTSKSFGLNPVFHCETS